MASHASAHRESVNSETAKQWFDRSLAHLLGQSARQFARLSDMDDPAARSLLLDALDARYDRVLDDDTGVVTISLVEEMLAPATASGDPVLSNLGNGYLATAGQALAAIRIATGGWDELPCELANALLSADESLKELKLEVGANGASLAALALIDELGSEAYGLLPRIEAVIEDLDETCLDPVELDRIERFAALARRSLTCFREALEEIGDSDEEDVAALLLMAEDCGPEVAEEAASVIALLEDTGVPACAMERVYLTFKSDLVVGGSAFDRIDLMRALRICEQGPRSWPRLAARGSTGIEALAASAYVVGTIARALSSTTVLKEFAWDEATTAEVKRAVKQFTALAIPICERLQEASELPVPKTEKPPRKTKARKRGSPARRKGPPKAEAADMPE